MNSSKITEGVGKKIVEALKQQSDVEIVPVSEEVAEPEYAVNDDIINNSEANEYIPQQSYEEINKNIAASLSTNEPSRASIDAAFNNAMLKLSKSSAQELNLAAVDEMELPANVAVLKQLITKMPAGVSKQTGALIIKQTMEALGISMTNVLQEAQQVQENLTQSVRECQSNVIEYKKQISVLEAQAQKYQRQFAALNDIISLFIQTN